MHNNDNVNTNNNNNTNKYNTDDIINQHMLLVNNTKMKVRTYVAHYILN